MIIHIFFLFPETAGKTLEEVEEMFLSDFKAWNTKVQYSSVRRAEMGDIDDNEKRISIGHHETRPEVESENTTTTEHKA